MAESTECSFASVLVRLYAAECETGAGEPDVEAFLDRYPHATEGQRLNVILFDQYYQWRFGNGQSAEWYFERFRDVAARSDYRVKLVLEELDYLNERKRAASLADVQSRFPDLADDLKSADEARTPEDRFCKLAELLQCLFHGGSLAATRFLTSEADTVRVVDAVDTKPASDMETSVAGTGAFASLSPDILRLIESRMHEEHFSNGEYLMREGEPGTSLMVLMDGPVEVSVSDESGGRTLITRTTDCQVFGEMSLVTNEPRSANIVAVGEVTVMVLPAAAFRELVSRYPSISMVLTALISQRLGRTGRHDVMTGKTFGEHYRIHGRLGRGGMAVVYEATDSRTQQRVALKMMSHRLVYDEEARDQFQHEADLIEEFDHSNIARMLGRFPAFGTFFTVMEFCDGITLADLLRANGPLSEEDARAVLGQVADALRYAHSKAIIHRDIKPANIMVNRDGRAMLMDFGLAKPVADTHPALVDLMVGTPRYMAPEQMIGAPVGPPADYFGLGCVAWEVVSGRELLPESDIMGLLRCHADWDAILKKVAVLKSTLKSSTYEMIMTCLHEAPETRTLNLEEIATWAKPLDVSRLQGFRPIETE